jgi:hypothetical protein
MFGFFTLSNIFFLISSSHRIIVNDYQNDIYIQFYDLFLKNRTKSYISGMNKQFYLCSICLQKQEYSVLSNNLRIK